MYFAGQELLWSPEKSYDNRWADLSGCQVGTFGQERIISYYMSVNSSKRRQEKWVFAVDRGGTFTDIVGFEPSGTLHTRKLLSVSDAYDDAGIEGIRSILGIQPQTPLDPERIGCIRIGTTVATNALLERKGAFSALFTTEGFEDLLSIGNGTRPDLFNIKTKKPHPIYDSVHGFPEEVDASGTVKKILDQDAAERMLRNIRESGYDNIAIVLKHSWINPVHEKIVARIARELIGIRHVVASHEVMPLINFLKRGQTTMLEAYLGPVLFSYADTLTKLAGPVRIEFMQSSGGLISSGNLRAKDTILSGPAGGVIGSGNLSEKLGIRQSIGFDMGGTSTDVSRFDGDFHHVFENTVAGVPFHTDMLDVETVAAGGGSILSFDGERLLVGPESAGSNPGPACYGLGGPLTVTDANLLLGRIIPDVMPSTFGPEHQNALDISATRMLFTDLANKVNRATGNTYTPEALAEGYLKIANEIMCRAMKKISVSRGYDIRHHALICFGGAAPQHACDIARILGIERIIIHPLSSVLSAYGIAVADRRERTAYAVMEPLDKELPGKLKEKAGKAAERLAQRVHTKGEIADITIRIFLDLRPQGTDTWLSIPAGEGTGHVSFDPVDRILERFRKDYYERFGFRPENETTETVNIRIDVSQSSPLPDLAVAAPSDTISRTPLPVSSQSVWISGALRNIPVFDRTGLIPGQRLDGPAMVTNSQLTLFIQEGFTSRVDGMNNLLLTDISGGTSTAQKSETDISRPDPVMLEVFNNLFMNIAEQMGHTLSNTAHSVNMKERHDFSCALFDEEGRLIAHAPHIPVHLGAMEATVRHIIEENRETMRNGDMYLANNPHQGGSHLPDMTIVTPVFCREEKPSYYLANRGHHADIGGITPGSMPPSSKTIYDEGIVIGNFLLVRDGRFREKEVTGLLSSGNYPARNIPERLSDLRAQIAANNKGLIELLRMNETYGTTTVQRYMTFIRNNARHAMEHAIKKLVADAGKHEFSYSDRMDNGAVLSVSLRAGMTGQKPELIADFTGTGPQDPGNINAPRAVATAAVLYSLRCLIDENIPLNAGCLDPVTIIIPEPSLLNPSKEAAVAVGNVETSQRIVDILLGALSKAAASQGTMNNLLFGKPDNSGAQYYETIPGGAGAAEGCHGASALQVHMTNTRITDPEILEHRFPAVRITRFSVRRNSGGSGKWNGGNGVTRVFLFNEPMQVSVISERRNTVPFGLNGGKNGSSGKNLLILADGTEASLGYRVDRIFMPGESLSINTPGGGGFGS